MKIEHSGLTTVRTVRQQSLPSTVLEVHRVALTKRRMSVKIAIQQGGNMSPLWEEMRGYQQRCEALEALLRLGSVVKSQYSGELERGVGTVKGMRMVNGDDILCTVEWDDCITEAWDYELKVVEKNIDNPNRTR
jgi:hypothetical protein|tara:strand:+ start:370 stop:771 length:402 start_codon:yes stop_codon:yes gene_type:complete